MSVGYKIIAALVIVAAYSAGCIYLGYKWEHGNTVAAEAKTKSIEDSADLAASKARAESSAETTSIQNKYNDIVAKYEALQNEPPTVSVADSTFYGIGKHTLILRDNVPQTCTSISAGSATTAASRAADAAATQALADRVKDSVAAIQAGDAADAREFILDKQIVALQAMLQADRQTTAVVPGK